MRILFITPWYPYPDSPNHGIFIQDQAVAVATEHEVVVIAAEVNYKKFGIVSYEKEETVFRKVHEHRITILRSLPFFNTINYLLITLFYARRICRRFKPDIIHGNIGFPGAFWAMAAARPSGIPFVVTEHAGRFRGHFRSWFHRILTIFSLRRASEVIAVSNYTKALIESETKIRPVVVPNIIDFEKFGEPEPRQRHAGESFHIGFLGLRNENNKGLDLLFEALRNFPHPFVLHIGGGGILLESFKLMAVDFGIDAQCIFYGVVNHLEVPAFMKRLDFYVSASRFESFGMVVLEAMGMGMPVVVTNSGGVVDFVSDKNGIIVENGNPASLRDGIIKMIAMFDNYDRLEIARFARENYSAAVFLRRIASIYRDATARK